MKIFPSNSVKELDAYTIGHEPIASIDLMERAVQTLTKVIIERWDITTPIMVFAGPGNSGGNTLTVARMLAEKEYRVETYLLDPKEEPSADYQANEELVETMDSVKFSEVNTQLVPPTLTMDHLIADGLFGSGLNKPLNGGFTAVVKYINTSPVTVVAIDIPSGLMREENTFDVKTNIIRTHLTLSLQLPKLAFLFAENAEFVDEWKLLDISLSHKAIEETESNYALLEAEEIHALIKPRSPFSHKGNFRHALLIAGSYGIAGASVPTARACIHPGVGLLTVHTLARNNDILQISVPEAIVELDASDSCFVFSADTDDYQTMGIGPGIGRSKETETALFEQLSGYQTPLMLDAGALSMLANHRHALTTLPKGSVPTPHPKELERMVGKYQNSYERLMKACGLARAAKVHIILKGTYSAIITPSGEYYFNSTGDPGVATAGSGGVSTGVLLALLAQGYPAEETAKIGTYVRGLTGDLIRRRQGAIGITAGDIVNYLSIAWRLVSE